MVYAFIATFFSAGLATVVPQIEEHFASTPDVKFLARALITVLGPSGIVGALAGTRVPAPFRLS
jgi:hypothetical protein